MNIEEIISKADEVEQNGCKLSRQIGSSESLIDWKNLSDTDIEKLFDILPACHTRFRFVFLYRKENHSDG
jgi:hypothetical protein